MSGDVKFDNYDIPAREYQPATRQRRAQNVPRPVKPANARNNNTAGLYSAIGFFAASYTHMMITAIPDCLQECDLLGNKNISGLMAFFSQDSWSSDYQFIVTLKVPRPKQEENIYIWPCTVTDHLGDFMVKKGGVVEYIPEDKR